MGQNFAGVAPAEGPGRARARRSSCGSPSGSTRTARSTPPTSARPACIDTYICKGKGEALTWSPRFTFHGFQYVEITGLESTADRGDGHRHRPLQRHAGRRPFECSDPMLNKLHSNIYWTQRANFIDIPTDCPQRDERLGWTGDAQVYIRDGVAELRRAVVLHQVAGGPDRRPARRRPVPDGRPGQGRRGRRRAGLGRRWRDLPVDDLPVYGDRRVLERQYPSMVKFIEFCRKRSTPDLLPPKQVPLLRRLAEHQRRHAEGCHLHGLSSPRARRLTSQAAEVLGKTEDAKKYRELYERINERLQQGVRRPRRPDQGGHAGRLRAGDRLRPGRGASEIAGGRPSTSSRTSRSAAGTSRPASSAPRT